MKTNIERKSEVRSVPKFDSDFYVNMLGRLSKWFNIPLDVMKTYAYAMLLYSVRSRTVFQQDISKVYDAFLDDIVKLHSDLERLDRIVYERDKSKEISYGAK